MFGPYSADPIERMGSNALILGVLMIFSPIGLALMLPMQGHAPVPIIEGLPSYNPTAIAYRHPMWLVVATAPIGTWLCIVARAFLGRRSWALVQFRYFCMAAIPVLVVFGLLWGASIVGQSSPIVAIFGVSVVGMCAAMTAILIKALIQLKDPSLQREFNGY